MSVDSRARWCGSARDFIESCRPAQLEALVTSLGSSSPSEKASWRKSLPRVAAVLNRVPDLQVWVILEFNPHQMGRSRVDVILAGFGHDQPLPTYVVMELKQWSKADLDAESGKVLNAGTRYGLDGLDDPYSQAERYSVFIRNYTSGFHDDAECRLLPVAYLHNASAQSIGALLARSWTSNGRFYTGDSASEDRLATDLTHWFSVRTDGRDVANRLLEAPAEQSPRLLDALADILSDPDRYPLTPMQQDIFKQIQASVEVAVDPRADRTQTIIVVQGGPGTGKTWLAMHLLGANAKAHRQVSYANNSGSMNSSLQKRARARIRSLDIPVEGLFSSARTYWKQDRWVKPLDVLLVDEAHRVTQWTVRTGHNNARHVQAELEQRKQTQLFELKKSAKVLVLFIDEEQAVTAKDACTISDIEEMAARVGANFELFKLEEQHRCGGSQAYEEWVRTLLAGHPHHWAGDPRFQVEAADSPWEMEDRLDGIRTDTDDCRIVAGFCWEWSKVPDYTSSIADVPKDVVIGDWKKRWNLRKKVGPYPTDTDWAYDRNGAEQVGCIFTAQGFEFSWCGVILGNDLVWRRDHWVVNRSASRNRSLLNATKDDPARFAALIKNHYRVLLTRGMKGSIVYSTDAETQVMLTEMTNA